MLPKDWLARILIGLATASCLSAPPIAAKEAVPGQWGTTDTSREIVFRDRDRRYVYRDHEFWWAGDRDVRAQWMAIFPDHVDAENGYTWYHANHAKAEPAGNAKPTSTAWSPAKTELSRDVLKSAAKSSRFPSES